MYKYTKYTYIYIFTKKHYSQTAPFLETFLALSADKQTRNSDTKCLKHHPY